MSLGDDMARVSAALSEYVARGEMGDGPVVEQPAMAELAERLDLEALIGQGGLSGARLERFLADYLAASHHIQHPASMGHQVSVPHPAAILGGLVDVATNNPMAIYEMGPAAATVEFAVINWMLRKVGWQPHPWPGRGDPDSPHGAGVLTHGGSLAQLTALAAARAQACPEAWQEGVDPALAVVAPPDAHYSIARALGILGLGQRALIPAPCDELGRIAPEGLDATLKELEGQGRKIMAVTANAGCTAAGLYDDFSAIADVCEAHGVWLHVDGAHGASALLSPRYRHLLAGVERAHSLIWDAHKMMRAPGLCAAVLVRDHAWLDHAFQQKASYLFHDKEQTGFDAISRTIECTKAGMGTKFFFALAADGEQGMADYVESRYDLGREAARVIAGHPAFELACPPQANIVCFRIKGTSDAGQLRLRKALLATGKVYVTTTEFAGSRWLRLALMNPATTLADIEAMLALLLDVAKNDS